MIIKPENVSVDLKQCNWNSIGAQQMNIQNQLLLRIAEALERLEKYRG